MVCLCRDTIVLHTTVTSLAENKPEYFAMSAGKEGNDSWGFFHHMYVS